jgi:hypothetical protein
MGIEVSCKLVDDPRDPHYGEYRCKHAWWGGRGCRLRCGCGCLMLLLLFLVCGGLGFGVLRARLELPCLPLVCQAAARGTQPTATPRATATSTATATATPQGPDQRGLQVAMRFCADLAQNNAADAYLLVSAQIRRQFPTEAQFARSLQPPPNYKVVGCALNPASYTVAATTSSVQGTLTLIFLPDGNHRTMALGIQLVEEHGAWLVQVLRIG